MTPEGDTALIVVSLIVFAIFVAITASRADQKERRYRDMPTTRPIWLPEPKTVAVRNNVVVYDKAKGIGVKPPVEPWDPQPIRQWNARHIAELARKHGYVWHGKRYPKEEP